MRAMRWVAAATMILAWLLAGMAFAQQNTVAVVSHVKVLSDKVTDVSSLEAWKKSYLKDGMKDQEKALAIWNSVVAFTFDTTPPQEYLTWENGVDDPIKDFNVYGYDLCNDIASLVTGLGRYAGFKAQGQNLQGHNVCDLWYDNSWHYLDAAFGGYFPKADGTLASTDEVFDAVKKWYDEHPDMKGDAAMNKRRDFAKNEGWKNGPEILSRCPTYDKNGAILGPGHGWWSDMREFDGKVKGVYETGYSNGYEVNVQLRAGEKLTRNWSNKGLHVNQLGGKGGEPTILNATVGKGDLKYTPKYGDLANGRIGNGTLEYDALRDAALAKSAMTFENVFFTEVSSTAVPAQRVGDGVRAPMSLRVKDPARDGVLVIRMPSSYVYLSGELALKANVGNGGAIVISLSDNNGLDWKDVTTVDKAGEQKIDLKPFVGRRYDYRLKFVLKGKDTGLDSLKITHDIQHSQRPLPALGQGENKIAFSAGPDTGTITIEGSTTVANKPYQLVLPDFHPTLENVKIEAGLMMTGGNGSVVFPIETPGEMTALRTNVFYRARDAKDAWTIEASFDGGESWKPIGKVAGPTKFCGEYFVFTDVPKGTTKALVRYTGKQGNTLMMFNLRLDADYRLPNAGFAPVQVTYVYDEGGKEKSDVHVAKSPSESWTITCAEKPTMKSLVVERAK